MTTNTARNAAAADGTWPTARSGGTSVLLQDLSRSFGTTRALDGLSIETRARRARRAARAIGLR